MKILKEKMPLKFFADIYIMITLTWIHNTTCYFNRFPHDIHENCKAKKCVPRCMNCYKLQKGSQSTLCEFLSFDVIFHKTFKERIFRIFHTFQAFYHCIRCVAETHL